MKTKIYFLTCTVDDYDQSGEYFEGVFGSIPTYEQAKQIVLLQWIKWDGIPKDKFFTEDMYKQLISEGALTIDICTYTLQERILDVTPIPD